MGKLTTSQKQTRTRRRNVAKRRAMSAARGETDPKWRLIADGSGSAEAIHKRLLWIARERGIRIAEIPTGRRYMTQRIFKFAERHGINFNWLLGGELKYLREMGRGPDPEKEALCQILIRWRS